MLNISSVIRTLGAGFGMKSLVALQVGSLRFLLTSEAVSSQLPAPTVILAAGLPTLMKFYLSGTVSPKKLFLLEVALVIVFHQRKRKVTNTPPQPHCKTLCTEK